MNVIAGIKSALRKTRIFSLLWARLFGLIILMAALEGILFYLMGFRYQSSLSPVKVWPGDLSIDRKGHYAALRVRIMGRLGKENWSDVVLIDLLRRDPVWLRITHLSPRYVTIAPDANWVAIASEGGDIYSIASPFSISTTAGRRKERLFVSSGDKNLSQLVFAPDGRSIAAIGERFVSVWDWPSGRLLHQRRYKPTGIAARSIIFSPDSRRLASPDVDGNLCLCDARSGESLQVIAVSETPYHTAAVAFDTQLVAITKGHLISVYGFGAGDVIWNAKCDSPIIDLSPSGRRLASITFKHGSTQIMIRDVETGLTYCRFDLGLAMTSGLEFASDNLLYSSDSHGNIQAWSLDSQREQWVISLLDSAPNNDGYLYSE